MTRRDHLVTLAAAIVSSSTNPWKLAATDVAEFAAEILDGIERQLEHEDAAAEEHQSPAELGWIGKDGRL